MGKVTKFYKYRGELKAVTTHKNSVIFITEHLEGQATGVYRLDPDAADITMDKLPTPAVGFTKDEKNLFILGNDGQIHIGPIQGGKFKSFGEKFDPKPKKILTLSNEKLAVLGGEKLFILSSKTAKILQELQLPEEASTMATNGDWIGVGTINGALVVFENENGKKYKQSGAKKIHQGLITSILFEQEELRVLTTSADCSLLMTHVRGELEPEDRGGSSMHKKSIQTMILGLEDKFYTASGDRCVKIWQTGLSKKRSATLQDAGNVVDMCIIEYNEKPHLLLACTDNSLRFCLIDEKGGLETPEFVIRDAYAWAKNCFTGDVRDRQAAIKELASYNDKKSLDLLAECVEGDEDHKLKVEATVCLGKAKHPYAIHFLEKFLEASEDKIRLKALDGLRLHRGEESLDPLQKALQTEHQNIGEAALQALEKLASKNDMAMEVIVENLENENIELGKMALLTLEKLYPVDSTEAEIVALSSFVPDIQKLALIRCYQRKFLEAPEIQAALIRAQASTAYKADAVRLTAFWISLLRCPKLVETLRGMDKNLHRKFHEIESYGEKEAKLPKTKEIKKLDLSEDDLKPLIQAIACPSRDVSLQGACALALLKDPRALGTLLQLSREKSTETRIAVCKALQNLKASAAIKRLNTLLHDEDSQVRDAAFTALSKIRDKEPLLAVETGFTSNDENIRLRALEILVNCLKKKSLQNQAQGLLERALNDKEVKINNEAFKVTLKLKIGGDTQASLRFALLSIHSNIRQNVLTEIMPQIKENWAWTLLLEFFNDADPSIRKEAFSFAKKNAKGKLSEVLNKGCESKYSDIRILATRELTHRSGKESKKVLAKALKDEESEVRELAIHALIRAEAKTELLEAMNNPYKDVKAKAARALAVYGESKTFATLLEAIKAKAEDAKNETEWKSTVICSLEGLELLGDKKASAAVFELLESKDSEIAKVAAKTLGWITDQNDIEKLRQALQHSNKEVKHEIAFNLAYHGDPSGSSILFGRRLYREKVRTLTAAFMLGQKADENFLNLLNENNLYFKGVMLSLFLELVEGNSIPNRLMALLTAQKAQIRMVACKGLENFVDEKKFHQFVMDYVNLRNDGKSWKVEEKILSTLAEIVVNGSLRLRLWALEKVLNHLEDEKRTSFDYEWNIFSSRFQKEISDLMNKAQKRKRSKSEYTQEQLEQIVFGVYIGLSRGHAIIAEGVIKRLMEMAKGNKNYIKPLEAVLTRALNSSYESIRTQAFSSLLELNFDKKVLASEAVFSGNRDIGALGLKLLTEEKDADKKLEEIVKNVTNGVEFEALEILKERIGEISAYRIGLKSRSKDLKFYCINSLSSLYHKEKEAPALLHECLKSKYQKIRFAAAKNLAYKKDNAAYDVLVEKLTLDSYKQKSAIQELLFLGDARTPDAYMDRIDNDSQNDAQAYDLFEAIGKFRQEKSAKRVMEYMEKSKYSDYAFNAVLKISGYDQKRRIEEQDPTDDTCFAETVLYALFPRRTRRTKVEKEEYPRYLDILIELTQTCYRLSKERNLKLLIPHLAWEKDDRVDQELISLLSYPSEEIRHMACESIGWRLVKRNASKAPLVQALEQKDIEIKFLAAEGLANGGHKEGIDILLTSVDMMPEIRLRKRAVRALGKLADEKALDTLLRLVSDNENVLQEEAAIAIGHMAYTDKAEAIFEILSKMLKRLESKSARIYPLQGLRWFNTREAWTLIRECIKDSSSFVQKNVIELLQYNDDPASRDIIVDMIKNGARGQAEQAVTSLRQLCGTESLEPTYLCLQSNFTNLEENILDMIREKGDPKVLFEIISEIKQNSYFEDVTHILINHSPLPIKEAINALDSKDWRTCKVAAQVLGRMDKKATKAQLEKVAKALSRSWQEWKNMQKEIEEGKTRESLSPITECCSRLIWCCGRLEIAADEIISILDFEHKQNLNMREEAVVALSHFKDDKSISSLEKAATSVEPKLRSIAMTCLSKIASKETEKLVEKATDFSAMQRLMMESTAKMAEKLSQAASNIHQQGIALSHLVKHEKTKELAKVAKDASIPEMTRLGAIEALAYIANKDAQKALEELANSEKEKDLCKATWRALRRAKRYFQKRESVKSK